MKLYNNTKALFSAILILLLTLAGVGILFHLTYQMDNKYVSDTAPGIQVLTDDWEFYPDTTREEYVQSNAPSKMHLITIGEFGTFRSFHTDSSPFGRALYRKELTLPDSSDGWLIELPEIFSAAQVYVNSELVRSFGCEESDNYQMHTQNSLVSLPSGSVEILIDTANYSHYYSGLISPPLLGTTAKITNLVICRLILYALLAFFTLGCSIISFRVWLRHKSKAFFVAYGILCFSYALHISYPLFHWIGLNTGRLSYTLEDGSYWMILTCMCIITYHLCQHIIPRFIHIIAYGICFFMMIWTLFSYYILFSIWPQSVLFHGALVGWCKLLLSFYLIIAAFLSVLRDPGPTWLLCGNAVFGFGIFYDYLTAGKYEPIRFAYQTEYCGFFMVILFTILILRYNHQIILEREYLTEHLQDEVARKTLWLTNMMEDRKAFLSSVAHDLKAPVAAINTYIDYIRNSPMKSDEEMQHYLDIIDHKSIQIQSNVQNLQMFHNEGTRSMPPEVFDLGEFLRVVYEETLPYTDANGIHYHLEIPSQPFFVFAQKESLFRTFENLVINATEHTPLEGSITFCTVYEDHVARILFQDDGEGILPEHLEQIFHYQFSTKASEGIRGLGLYFVKNSLEEYGGSITVDSLYGSYTAFHITLPEHRTTI